ncbi:type VII secretion-associated protein [Prauserella rugosa]|uniref:Type VII secretion-associated protein (TIGR03931 family) n=1 Tax=Prauserella rugosa TaxID=43354 RepID=A0A660CK45_9PSEU|nr:type VII secretion-associated protein [Prauserella rugosa]KMS89533.1 molecular chaperone [Streptomyces regensis]TWH22247.1 type VII secretion-associated protein (TIGR03931 family) [Prauserella rugosa]
MTFRVAIDFGTSSTCVVAAIGERQPQVVVIDGQPLMPSAVYAHADGTLFVGQEAERQAAVDPARFEPTPKRRIDEGELLLGDTVLNVVDVVRAVLSRAVGEARRLAAGAEIDLLVLTHPADWGAVRTRLLRQAASGLGHEVALVPEPVAAAVFHAATYAPAHDNPEKTVAFTGKPGDTLAVFDFGGGTIDVSVVRRTESQNRRTAFEVPATRGDPGFGGADIDQALLEHVGSLVSSADRDAWEQLVQGRELADRRRRRVLRQDVRGAKETLSRHAYTDVPMPPPFADAHVTREQLEELVAAPLGRAVELAVATIEEAGLRPKQLTAIFLVGGSSRIPMLSRLIHERTGVVPTTLDQPETVVARGALRAVQVIPDRGGAVPGALPGAGDEATSVVRRPESAPQQPHGPHGTGRQSAGSARPGAYGAQSGPNTAPYRPQQPGGHHPGTQPPQHPSGQHPSGSQAGRRPHSPQTPRPGVPAPHAQGGHGQGGPGKGGHGQAGPGTPHGGGFAQQHPGFAASSYTAASSTAGSGEPGGEGAGTGTNGGRKRALVWSALGLVVLLAGAAAVWFFVIREDEPEGTRVSRFSYSFIAPQGWKQLDENVERANITYGPADSSGSDLVVVQQIQQDFDAGKQRRRLFDEIRQDGAARPDKYRGFKEHHGFAGRDTIHYTEKLDGIAEPVRWYILANGSVQVSVGCQTDKAKKEVAAGCEQIVQTLEFTN